ncbi:MAG TPA: STAS domain-containing protein [Steroidobacteraceae bacterium]|jgi:anti-anti-sigma factor|nr:STAS domain-containing protein [Steroidobacteraceae bacterium]
MSNATFDIRRGASGEAVLAGRLDATQCDAALKFLNEIPDLRAIDLGALEYIASAGLRVMLLTQKRCKAAGAAVRLINVKPPVHDIFRYAGFDQIFEISAAG